MLDVLGTLDPETIRAQARAIETDAEEIFFFAASVGALFGVRRSDGSCIAIKVNKRPGSEEYFAQVQELQRLLASGGYPGSYRTGVSIHGIEDAEATGATVFHAGTRTGPGGLETAGGRVLGVTAAGQELGSAIERAYDATHKIRFEGMHYRTDIGNKGLGRYNIGVPGT